MDDQADLRLSTCRARGYIASDVQKAPERGFFAFRSLIFFIYRFRRFPRGYPRESLQAVFVLFPEPAVDRADECVHRGHDDIGMDPDTP